MPARNIFHSVKFCLTSFVPRKERAWLAWHPEPEAEAAELAKVHATERWHTNKLPRERWHSTATACPCAFCWDFSINFTAGCVCRVRVHGVHDDSDSPAGVLHGPRRRGGTAVEQAFLKHLHVPFGEQADARMLPLQHARCRGHGRPLGLRRSRSFLPPGCCSSSKVARGTGSARNV
jgi:hypothetical protein